MWLDGGGVGVFIHASLKDLFSPVQYLIVKWELVDGGILDEPISKANSKRSVPKIY